MWIVITVQVTGTAPQYSERKQTARQLFSGQGSPETLPLLGTLVLINYMDNHYVGFKVMFLGLVNYILKPDRQLLSRTDVEVTSCSVARGEAVASPIPFSPWCFEKKRLLKNFF